MQTGTLECGPLPLNQQIQQFAQTLLSQEVTQLDILPLFLLPGVHVMKDIPTAVTVAQQRLGESIQLRLRPYLGSHPQMVDLLRDRLSPDPAAVHILLAHGSRYPGGTAPVQQLAAQLGVELAYWVGDPNLETCLAQLSARNRRQIGILPYFLFARGIIDILTARGDQLKWEFDLHNLLIAPPLEPNLQMAGLLLDLI